MKCNKQLKYSNYVAFSHFHGTAVNNSGLVMSNKYITNHFSDIKKYASVVENRMDDENCTIETVLRDNAEILEQCQNYKVNYLLIDDEYQVDIEL